VKVSGEGAKYMAVRLELGMALPNQNVRSAMIVGMTTRRGKSHVESAAVQNMSPTHRDAG